MSKKGRFHEMEKEYKHRFESYSFRIVDHSGNYNSTNESLDVHVSTKDGLEYIGTFTTLDFIRGMFKKNRETGECGGGTFFCQPNMIIVKEISDKSVRRTIDSLINDLAFDRYFVKKGK